MKPTRKITAISLVPVLLLTVTTLSCKKESGEEKSNHSVLKEGLTIRIGGQKYETKALHSGKTTGSFTLGDLDGINGLMLSEEVSMMDDSFFEASATKGTPVYNENFDNLYSEQFYATAFETKSGRSIFSDVWGADYGDNGNVKFNKIETNTYHFNYSDSSSGLSWNLAWPDNGRLHYFFQAPYNVTKNLHPSYYSNGDIEFDYTDPTSPTPQGNGNPVIENGAAGQTDILFGSKELELKPERESAIYNVTLHHTFTAVKFRVGNIDKNVTTKIKKVTLTNLYANGHCTVSPEQGTITWTAHSIDDALIADYSQTFSGVVNYTTDNSSFGDSFYNGKSELDNLNNADCSETLLFIPQDLTSTYVILDFTIDGEEFQRKVKLNSKWKAGEIHTYTLTVNKVDVTVTDEMNSNLTVKSEVVTANSGNVTAYLRATAICAWYYGYGKSATIVAPYNGHGVFMTDGAEGYDSFWIPGEDGNYYYPLPVDPGNATKHPLFDTFTAPTVTQEAPFPYAHLEMRILLQGVQFDKDLSKAKVRSAWGDIKVADGSGKLVVDLLSTTPESN